MIRNLVVVSWPPSSLSIDGNTKNEIEYGSSWSSLGVHVTVLTSPSGASFLRRNGLIESHSLMIRSDSPDLRRGQSSFWSFGIKYLRYVSGVVRNAAQLVQTPSNSTVLFTPTASLGNVLPALIVSSIKKCEWILPIYHFAPLPSSRVGKWTNNLSSYVLQNLSFLLCRWATFILTETTEMKGEISQRLAYNEAKIIVAFAGIDSQLIDSVFPSDRLNSDACFIGRLSPTKGIFDLPLIWRKVCDVLPNAKLLVIGPEYRSSVSERFRREIIRHGLERNIILLGEVAEKEKFRVLKGSKLLLHPSYEEGIPIPFLEAAYCGCTILAYSLRNYRDVRRFIEEVAPGDIDAMAAKCLEVLSSSSYTHLVRLNAKEHEWREAAARILGQMNERQESSALRREDPLPEAFRKDQRSTK